MPKLLEYQSKRLLKAEGIRVPEGDIATTPAEAGAIAGRLSRPVVVKAQVGVTGRFAAGGIRFAESAAEAERIAGEMLGGRIKGLAVERVLVEERLAVRQELYAGVIVSDSYRVKGPVLMLSTQGGADIETVAAASPERVASLSVDILKGVTSEDVTALVAKLGLSGSVAGKLGELGARLYHVFRKYDARSLEVNPVVLTEAGDVFAADCHIVVDEASVFRQPELQIDFPRDIGREPTELEKIAWRIEQKDYRGIGYFVQMASGFKAGEGYIGFHGIGGGAAMLGADALMRHGLRLANYADTSGSPTAAKAYRIIKIILSQPNIDGYALMGACIANQEQWHTAHAAVRALREDLVDRPGFPVIILIAGNKEMESLEILSEGLKGLPARIEVYGRDYVYDVNYIAARMRQMVQDYRRGR